MSRAEERRARQRRARLDMLAAVLLVGAMCSVIVLAWAKWKGFI